MGVEAGLWNCCHLSLAWASALLGVLTAAVPMRRLRGLRPEASDKWQHLSLFLQHSDFMPPLLSKPEFSKPEEDGYLQTWRQQKAHLRWKATTLGSSCFLKGARVTQNLHLDSSNNNNKIHPPEIVYNATFFFFLQYAIYWRNHHVSILAFNHRMREGDLGRAHSHQKQKVSGKKV